MPGFRHGSCLDFIGRGSAKYVANALELSLEDAIVDVFIDARHRVTFLNPHASNIARSRHFLSFHLINRRQEISNRLSISIKIVHSDEFSTHSFFVRVLTRTIIFFEGEKSCGFSEKFRKKVSFSKKLSTKFSAFKNFAFLTVTSISINLNLRVRNISFA